MDQIATLQQQLSKSTPARETIAPASTAEESGGLKEMLEQALTKMSKLEKDLEAAKNNTPNSGSESASEDENPEEPLVTLDGKTAPW